MPTVGSLFSGIGGLDLGLERAGFEIKWQVEKDPYCQKVLRKHWPGVTLHDDIRTVGKHNLEPVDLICGGWPCQPFSVAGKRRGKEDDRYLWPEVMRIIEELRPAWFLGENVPGIVGMDLDNVLAQLEGEGYGTRAFIIPACGLGAPHRRYRVFVVAYSERNRFQRAEYTICRQRTPNMPRRSPDASGEKDVAYSENAVRWRADGTENPRWWNSEAGGCREPRDWQKYWPDQPGICGVANGVPHRVDRLRALGNAVVPQVAEFIGRRILEVMDV
jgi:DNA (cytosine-5)-methyltransferase 1